MPTARQLTGDGDILLACNAVSFIFLYYKYMEVMSYSDSYHTMVKVRIIKIKLLFYFDGEKFNKFINPKLQVVVKILTNVCIITPYYLSGKALMNR